MISLYTVMYEEQWTSKDVCAYSGGNECAYN